MNVSQKMRCPFCHENYSKFRVMFETRRAPHFETSPYVFPFKFCNKNKHRNICILKIHVTHNTLQKQTRCNIFLSLVLHCSPNSCRDYITSEMSRKHLHVEGACEIEIKQFLAFIKCTCDHWCCI